VARPNVVRPKILRVVTNSSVVPWHMRNTLCRIAADFDVTVVGDNVESFKREFPQIQFVNLRIARNPDLGRDVRALIILCMIIFRLRPDVVHSIMPKAALLAGISGMLCGVPSRIHTFTGQTWARKRGIARFVLILLDRIVVRCCTHCLTDSRSQSEYLRKNGIVKYGRSIPVLASGSLSGVDLARFDPLRLHAVAGSLASELGIESDTIVFGYIARKTRDKGAVDALKVFFRLAQEFSTVRLLFVGPDEHGEISHLHETSPDLFFHVIEVGEVSNHEAFLALTNILCLPSYREGFGSIVIEAAAMGIPTIGSRIPGLTDAIDDGATGLLFEPGNLLELESKMRQLAVDSEYRSLLGLRAKHRAVSAFSANLLYDALRKFYESLPKRGKRSPKVVRQPILRA